MKWIMLLISPSEAWPKFKNTSWLIVPILVGIASALCNFYITVDPNVIYLKSEVIVRLTHNNYFTLPEGEGVIKLALTLSFVLLPLWYIFRILIESIIVKRIFNEDIDYGRLLLIFSLSLLPLIPIRLVTTYFLKIKGLESLADLRDLNITLSPVLFYALNRDILRNDTLYLFLREVSLQNIWCMGIFVGTSSKEGISPRYSIFMFLIPLLVVRSIEILWENYSYNIIWFLLVGG
ncbi:MAG: hypothetical protein ACP5K2_03400 [bacterium]